MSLRSSVRAVPTLLKVGAAAALAYRAELLVWVLSTTMPLVMMVLWTAVAADAPVLPRTGRGAYGEAEFISYFLSMFIVRQLTSSWAAWEMNMEVRQGTLSARLLKPIHPMLGYATENVAMLPLRVLVAVPVAVIGLATVGAGALPKDPVMWLLVAWSLAGGWLITLLANLAIGSLSLYLQSSIKVMDVWLTMYFVFSGYLFPLDLLPQWLQGVASALPFRYQIGLPVELLNSRHTLPRALELLAGQAAYIAVGFGVVQLLWKRGLRRFGAFGG